MLDTLTSERLASHVGDCFRMQVDGAPAIDVELIAVEPGGERAAEMARAGGRRAPFSILFRGPRAPVFPQHVYRLEHPALGALDIFLVPVGFDEQGLRYQAVFS